MSDRYIFSVAVEAFFRRAMGERLDADTRGRLKEAGIALDEPLHSVYRADVFHRCVALASEAVHRELPPEEAHYEAGREHLRGFVESVPGKLMLALARQLEPHTILDYTATFIRLGNNFTEARSRSLGPGRAEVWLNDVGVVPGWYGGIIECGLELSGVKGVSVRLSSAPSPGAAYAVSWTGRA